MCASRVVPCGYAALSGRCDGSRRCAAFAAKRGAMCCVSRYASSPRGRRGPRVTAVDATGTLARLRKSRKRSRALHATCAMILTVPPTAGRAQGGSIPWLPCPRPHFPASRRPYCRTSSRSRTTCPARPRPPARSAVPSVCRSTPLTWPRPLPRTTSSWTWTPVVNRPPKRHTPCGRRCARRRPVRPACCTRRSTRSCAAISLRRLPPTPRGPRPSSSPPRCPRPDAP